MLSIIGERVMVQKGQEELCNTGFDTLGLEEIVSFTAVESMRSLRVMEKIGMHHDEAHDFDYPKLQQGHPLKRHVLYRLKSNEWRQQQGLP
jgi:RimJ/RimL family protein N-acetyltransferase